MHRGLGWSARRGEPSAPCFDLTSTLGRLCARLEVRINIDSDDELVDSTVYRAREIIAYGCSGGQRARE
jgi:hypothetical protein